MIALIDADILRYELGFAVEVGWKGDSYPPFSYVEELFEQRLELMLRETGATSHIFFLSGENNFRNEIAKTKVYKGTRKNEKPFHYANLTAYIKGMCPHDISDGIEADDEMAIEQTERNANQNGPSFLSPSIIVSRDKDLRQVPGWHYGWEIGQQPSFGPELVDPVGRLELTSKVHVDKDGKPVTTYKLRGTGYKFFAAQCLMGDVVDNIPGCPKCGPVKAYNLLQGLDTPRELEEAVYHAYEEIYGRGGIHEDMMEEQAQLCWLVRRYNEDGSPEMWRFGLYE